MSTLRSAPIERDWYVVRDGDIDRAELCGSRHTAELYASWLRRRGLGEGVRVVRLDRERL